MSWASQQLILDCFRGQTDLGKEEDRVEESDDTESHKDQVGSVADSLKHHGSGEGDSEVHEPAEDVSSFQMSGAG